MSESWGNVEASVLRPIRCSTAKHALTQPHNLTLSRGQWSPILFCFLLPAPLTVVPKLLLLKIAAGPQEVAVGHQAVKQAEHVGHRLHHIPRQLPPRQVGEPNQLQGAHT